MSDWQKTEEDGIEYFINEELGNIVKIGDNMYVAMAPRIVKIGPFQNPEAAQKHLEEKKEELDKYVEEYNLRYLETLRKGE